MSSKREDSFLKRHYLKAENLEHGAKLLKDLKIGNHVYIQEQHGTSPRKWSKSGVVVEVLGHDSFMVKIDGLGLLTRSNRQFLRHFTPFLEDGNAGKAVSGLVADNVVTMDTGVDWGCGALSGLLELPLSTVSYLAQMDLQGVGLDPSG